MSGVSVVEIYYDVVKEIEIYELRLEDLEKELQACRHVMYSGKIPSENMVFVPLNKTLEHYDGIVDQIQQVSAELDKKRNLKKQIEGRIRKFEGIDKRVVYLRDIQNMPLALIAKELGYSLDWIKRISSRNPKKPKV